MPCHVIQTCEPGTGIIVIDMRDVFDLADAINDLSGLIKLKRDLGQAVMSLKSIGYT
jgi:hypothetical protein